MNVTVELLNQALNRSDWPCFNAVSLYQENSKQSVMQCDISIEASLSYLAGHFPEQPVVPGVVQVHWAGELAQRYLLCTGFHRLKNVKFSNTILPETSLQLILQYQKESQQVSFEYSDQDRRYSTGVIAFQ